MWRERNEKAMFRSLAVRKNRRAARRALFLPSREMLCVKEARQTGAINRATHIVAVEQNKRTAKVIQGKLPRMFPHNEIHRKPIHRVDLRGSQLDFAFFDLCGQITSKVARWVLDFDGTEFKSGAKVCWTFSVQHRLNLLVRRLQRMEKYPGENEFRNKAEQCPHFTINPFATTTWDNDNLTDRIFLTLYTLYGAIRKAYDIRFDRVHEYHDHTPMVYVEMTILGQTRKVRASSKSLDGIIPLTSKRKERTLPEWQQLGCPETMTPGQKAGVVRRAHKGVGPSWFHPAQWAWHPCNPKGIRRNKAA